MDMLDRVQIRICSRWAADNELDHSVDTSFPLPGSIEDGAWNGLVRFLSIMWVHHIVMSSYYVLPFSLHLQCPVHQCYVKGLHSPS